LLVPPGIKQHLRGTPACTFPPPIQDILCAVPICHGHMVAMLPHSAASMKRQM